MQIPFPRALAGAALALAGGGWLAWTTAAAAADPRTAAPAAPTRRVEIRDFHFQPPVLTVPAGATITFVNRDEEPHTVASADGKFRRSRALDTDQEYAVTLVLPGEYLYFCTVHPMMTGKIVVSTAAAVPAAQP